ncbi:DNA repair and recombination protein RadB [Methanobrevibacter filiformis]|uniref:DNA repair and recombination protein RadB n=1 Tax=Methanobrevibacter filiformis TaxID=55758 RepID=A0A165Z656_9EURY|nr:DNA repair and recombination protein RadB [Methanobrevibacter filiformis]KZX10294.1 protein RecA [Methanobrevibacter filiformis]
MKPLASIKETERIATNSSIDEIIGGGIEKGSITQIYGPPGSGKTNIALKLSVGVAKTGQKVIYIDTEGGLSIDRIKQIAKRDIEAVANNIYVYEPHSFNQQEDDLNSVITWLKNNGGEDIDLIVLDSAVALYRLNENKASILNKIMGKQMGLLSKIARKYNIAILITNQIYSNFDDEGINKVTPVGGTILKYWSKVIIELQKSDVPSERIATLQRHRHIAEGLITKFKITSDGIK